MVPDTSCEASGHLSTQTDIFNGQAQGVHIVVAPGHTDRGRRVSPNAWFLLNTDVFLPPADLPFKFPTEELSSPPNGEQ